MPDYTLAAGIVRRVAVRMVPGALALAAALWLAGWKAAAVGLLAGATFALCRLYLLAHAAVCIACQSDPGRAQRMAAHSYAVRYVLTALFLLVVIQTGAISLPAAILPLFAPGFVLAAGHLWGKGGESLRGDRN